MLNVFAVPYAFAALYCKAALWVARKSGNQARIEKLEARISFHAAWIAFMDGRSYSAPKNWWRQPAG